MDGGLLGPGIPLPSDGSRRGKTFAYILSNSYKTGRTGEVRTRRRGAIGMRHPWYPGVTGTDFLLGAPIDHLSYLYMLPTYLLFLCLASLGIYHRRDTVGKRLFVITFIDTPDVKFGDRHRRARPGQPCGELSIHQAIMHGQAVRPLHI
jgi:hypothetical protein